MRLNQTGCDTCCLKEAEILGSMLVWEPPHELRTQVRLGGTYREIQYIGGLGELVRNIQSSHSFVDVARHSSKMHPSVPLED